MDNPATIETTQHLLKTVTAALSGKAEVYTRLFDYYAGKATTPLVSSRLREVYQNLDLVVSENWCAVVVDAATDRMNLAGLDVNGDEKAQQALDEALQEAELLIEADDAHQAALITGESFIIAWDEEGEIESYYNDPRMCHAFYDPQRPNKMTMAAKWWDTEDRTRRLVIYTDKELRTFETPLNRDGTIRQSEATWEIVDTKPNPHGAIPVFHLRPRRRSTQSDLTNVTPIQDAINILLTNMLVTAEFAAAPMKYVISNSEGIDSLRTEPNRIWHIPAASGLGDGGTQVGQFAAADLSNYMSAIGHLIDTLASITRTPRFYFFGSQSGTMAPPSGESLKVMEAPLVKKVKDHTARFDSTYRQLAVFLCKLKGITIKASQVKPRWADVETIQPLQDQQIQKSKADTVEVKKNKLGISQKQAWRELGYSDEEIAQMEQEKKEEPPPAAPGAQGGQGQGQAASNTPAPAAQASGASGAHSATDAGDPLKAASEAGKQLAAAALAAATIPTKAPSAPA